MRNSDLDNVQSITFEGRVMEIFDPNEETIAAAKRVNLRGKPRFCVRILLAVLNKSNRNGHHITLEQADKTIASYGKRQEIPGNIDHKTGAYGTSYKMWVANRDEDQPELWIEALFWNRYITEQRHQEIMASYENNALGASWEIDKPFKLVADLNDEETTYIEDFQFNGFGLMVGDPPAEQSTQGTATITAGLNDDPGFWGYTIDAQMIAGATDAEKEAQKKRSTKYGIGVKKGGNITKPAKYKNVATASFADPVNFKWPVDAGHIRAAVGYFNHAGMRNKGHYSMKEWAKIGRKIARKAGQGYKFKGGKINTPSEEAGMEGNREVAADVMKTNHYGELPIDFLRAIPCPECGEWAKVNVLNFKTGKFELECMNGQYDSSKPSHRYMVSVEVESIGKVNASYYLAPVDGEALKARELNEGEVIEVVLVARGEQENNEEVNTVGKYTQEQMDAAVLKAEEDAKEKLKTDQEALETQQKETDQKIKDGVDAGKKEAAENAVAAHKASAKLAATRVDAAHAAMPYESEETKTAARDELMAMSEDLYTSYIDKRKLEGEVAKYKAELAELSAADATGEAGLGLDIDLGAQAGSEALNAGLSGGTGILAGENTEDGKTEKKQTVQQRTIEERDALRRWSTG